MKLVRHKTFVVYVTLFNYNTQDSPPSISNLPSRAWFSSLFYLLVDEWVWTNIKSSHSGQLTGTKQKKTITGSLLSPPTLLVPLSARSLVFWFSGLTISWSSALQKVHIDFSRAINMMCNLSHFLWKTAHTLLFYASCEPRVTWS